MSAADFRNAIGWWLMELSNACFLPICWCCYGENDHVTEKRIMSSSEIADRTSKINYRTETKAHKQWNALFGPRGKRRIDWWSLNNNDERISRTKMSNLASILNLMVNFVSFSLVHFICVTWELCTSDDGAWSFSRHLPAIVFSSFPQHFTFFARHINAKASITTKMQDKTFLLLLRVLKGIVNKRSKSLPRWSKTSFESL